MKKIIILLLCMFQASIQANVKVFINNSSKTFVVKVYTNKNYCVSITLAPGAVQDVFLPDTSLKKIIVHNENHMGSAFAPIAAQILSHKTSPINDNMIFIINGNHQVKMFPPSTSRDFALLEVDEQYRKDGKVPALNLSIQTSKASHGTHTQNVNYFVPTAKNVVTEPESSVLQA